MAEYLAHYGVPKMKWGVRRWQNEDGSLTPAGRIHYGRKLERAKNTSQGLKIQADTLATFRPMATGAGGVMAGVSGTTLMNTLPSVLSSQITDPQKALLIGGAAAVGMATVQASYRLASSGERWLASRQDRKIKEIEKILRDSDDNRNKESSKSSIDKVVSWVEENHASRLEAEEKHLSENLKGYRDDIVSAMSSYIQGSNDKKVKDSDIAEFLKDCAWIENSKDPDHIIDQRMSEYIDLYKQGKITNRQFSDMYESELSRAAAEIAYYGTKDIKRIRNMDPEYPDRTYEHYLSSLGVEVRKDSIPGQHWGMRRYQNSDGSLTEAGKARYKNRQSSGRYSYGTRESTKRGFVEIASKDSKNWKPISSKSGEREYEYIGPSGERAQAKAFRAADYTYAEIADMMNISESKVYDLLNK